MEHFGCMKVVRVRTMLMEGQTVKLPRPGSHVL